MRLFLDIGHYDGSAKRGAVEGRTITVVPDAPTDADPGTLLACAAAVADRPEGEQAARGAATAFSEVYAAAVGTVAVRQALSEGLRAANSAVRASAERGRAVALTALVLQGRRWLSCHAGNVRLWHYRDLQIKQLTRDHVAPRALRRVEVTRALGYGEHVDAEYLEGALQEGDIFLLTSPGLHNVLPGAALLGVLQADNPAQQLAETLVQQALAAGTTGYVGACVARVEKLPAESRARNDAAGLPMTDLPQTGAELDGFVVEKLMIKSRRYRLYKARDRESGTTVALRFPDPAFPGAAQTFLREEWMSRRVESPFLLKPVSLRPGRRTALYSAVEYRGGLNLAKRIRRKQGLALPEALRLAEQLLAGVEALHGQGLVHGDIRASSLIYDRIRRCVCLLGLGMERNQVLAEDASALRSSTLSYWAPELLQGSPATERSDIYAAGVTIYRMLTGKYPYGRIESRDDGEPARHYVPLRNYKENLPAALDDVLARACASNPRERYANVAEFSAALQAAAAAASAARPVTAPPANSMAWSWWAAAALAGTLLAYLYFALR